jgi:hypothetical protein
MFLQPATMQCGGSFCAGQSAWAVPRMRWSRWCGRPCYLQPPAARASACRNGGGSLARCETSEHHPSTDPGWDEREVGQDGVTTPPRSSGVGLSCGGRQCVAVGRGTGCRQCGRLAVDRSQTSDITTSAGSGPPPVFCAQSRRSSVEPMGQLESGGWQEWLRR